MVGTPPSPTPPRTWTYEEIKKLMEIVKTKQCLWKVDSPGYNSTVKKHVSIKEISVELNIPFEDVKFKYRKIRDQAAYVHKYKTLGKEYKCKLVHIDLFQYMIDAIGELKNCQNSKTYPVASGAATAPPTAATTASVFLNNSLTINKDISISSVEMLNTNINNKPNICQICLSMVDEESFFINLSDQINQQENVEHIVLKYFNFIQVKSLS